MIDRTKPLTEQDPGDLRVLIDALHGNRERYDRANRIVEARSCELEIAEATRALAILNRRATEADDRNREPMPCADGECKHAHDDWPVGSVTQRDLEFDQCSVCGWTEADAQRLRRVHAQERAAVESGWVELDQPARKSADQQATGGIQQHEVDTLLAVLRHHDEHEAHALVARMWTALQAGQQPAPVGGLGDLTEQHLSNLLSGYSGVAGTDDLPRLIAEVRRRRAQPELTVERVRKVVLRALTGLRSSAATSAERDAIATRAAKELAGAVVDPAQRDAEERALQEWAIDVVFDGPPGPTAGRFVEVEDLSGKSIGIGQWIDRGNGMWALRIPRAHPALREADLREAWIAAVQWAFERPATEAENARAAEYARSKAGG